MIFDADKVIEVMEGIVKDYGVAFVYHRHKTEEGYMGPECTYVWDNEPDCFIGHVMHRLGVPIDEAMNYDGTIDILAFNRDLPFDKDARRVLREAQAQQDQGENWFYCLKYARDAQKGIYSKLLP